MGHSDTRASRELVPTGRLKTLLVAGLSAVSLVIVAGPAAASTAIFLDKGEMFTPGRVTLSAPAGDNYPTITTWAGPVLFTANYGTSANTHNEFTFLGFCVDVFDTINVGVDVNQTLNLAYHDGPLVNNGEHTSAEAALFHTLTTAEKNEVSALVNYGTNLWNADTVTDPTHLNMSATLIDELAGVQGAIWKIENPTMTVVGAPSQNGWGGSNSGSPTAATRVNNYITSYVAMASSLPVAHMDVVYDSNLPAHQAFAFALPVPEPSTWGLMIMGFGAIGSALRRRRAQAACA